MTTIEISCETLLHYLSDYIDGELEDGLVDAARHHLASCDNCTAVLNTTARTIELVGDHLRQTLPAGRRTEIFAHLEREFSKSED